jgi:hypothetical protein
MTAVSRAFFIAALAASGFCSSATVANAWCRTYEHAGNYVAYGYSANRVTRCDITIQGDGTVTPGSQCRQLADGNHTIRGAITGGKLRITSACRVSGAIDLATRSGDNLTIKIPESVFSFNGSITGMGLDSTGLALFLVMQRID